MFFEFNFMFLFFEDFYQEELVVEIESEVDFFIVEVEEDLEVEDVVVVVVVVEL